MKQTQTAIKELFGAEHCGFAWSLGLPLTELEVARWAARSCCFSDPVFFVISSVMNNAIDVYITDSI